MKKFPSRQIGPDVKWLACCLILAAALAVTTANAQLLQGQANVDRVAAVGMVVSDMDRSVRFYSEVLSFAKVSDVEVYGPDIEYLERVFGVRMRVVRMRLGDEFIELTEFLTPTGRTMPTSSRSNDHSFQHIAIITSDMARAYQLLREHKVKHASTGPQLLPAYIKNAAGIRAFYFRDPDGHFLETLQFPADKGDAKWHRPTDKLFLGIDHTAIVVGDTDASLRFYQDALGMKVAGESENYGTEQEHLNNVFGARLRITALRAAAGPGIELLEYLAPRDGRPIPLDSGTADVWAWQTTLVTRDADAAARILLPGNSAAAITLDAPALGFKRGFLLRDPDGHLMRLAEQWRDLPQR